MALTTSGRHVAGGCRAGRRLSGFGSSVSPFVPPHGPVDIEGLRSLGQGLAQARRLLVLTGAGISTESDIPDYRSEGVGLYARSPRRPIRHAEFMGRASVRRRYWARNFAGWPSWWPKQPNRAHTCLAEWEARGRLSAGLITQNVDQLHFKAGSQRVIEMHGTNSTVICTRCCYSVPRFTFQRTLHELNPGFQAASLSVRPDGDVDIPPELVDGFTVPPCPRCGTDALKPSVIFFGDNLPPPIRRRVEDRVDACDALLVIGSSLQVYSGYRLVLQAQSLNKPVFIANIGPTRADHLATLIVHGRASDILAGLDAAEER